MWLWIMLVFFIEYLLSWAFINLRRFSISHLLYGNRAPAQLDLVEWEQSCSSGGEEKEKRTLRKDCSCD